MTERRFELGDHVWVNINIAYEGVPIWGRGIVRRVLVDNALHRVYRVFLVASGRLLAFEEGKLREMSAIDRLAEVVR